MRQSLWSMALAGLGLGSLAMVGSPIVGGTFGPLTLGYGVLVAFSAICLFISLLTRQRVLTALFRRAPSTTQTDRVAGLRVF